jgi:hypothetical protein
MAIRMSYQDSEPKLKVTLDEKEEQLLSTVGIPTWHDWQLLEDDAAEMAIIIEKANKILLSVLEDCQTHGRCWGEIMKAIYGPLNQLAREYPRAGLEDSEARQTVARFFALNYQLEIYDYLRYPD